MTREDITRMAMEVWSAGGVYVGPGTESLERFAALVAESEAQKLAEFLEALKLCRPHMYQHASNTPDGAFDALCAAIAKATGEQA